MYILKFLFFPFSLLYKFYFVLIFGLLMIILYPVYYIVLTRRRLFQMGFIIIRLHAYLLCIFGFIYIKGINKKNIPQTGPFIICANHTSFIDILCIYVTFKKYFVFTGKKEIEKWPLFHIFYTSGMNILVDRHSRKGAYKAFKEMANVIDQKHSLMIFPEGTISNTAPNMGEFKSGAFTIAIQKKVPILPITLINNWKLFGKGNILLTKARPGIAKVVIHPLVYTNSLSDQDTVILPFIIRDIIKEPLKSNK